MSTALGFRSWRPLSSARLALPTGQPGWPSAPLIEAEELMGDWLARWLASVLRGSRRSRPDGPAPFASLDRRIETAECDIREIEARLDLLEIQSDVRRDRD